MAAIPRQSAAVRGTAVFLCLCLLVSGCASSIVQIREPYDTKVRPGDGVKLTLKSGVLLTGRVTYADPSIVVIQTPRQITRKHPVKEAQFGSTIPWSEVEAVKVAGTLDSQRRLISNEEIRVNHRTNHRRNLAVNVGLVGLVGSFLLATALQDAIWPLPPESGNPDLGRFAFWSAFALGTGAAAYGGYQAGSLVDRKIAIARIERQRSLSREDSAMARSTPDLLPGSY
jgi:hypothetical protein